MNNVSLLWYLGKPFLAICSRPDYLCDMCILSNVDIIHVCIYLFAH